MRSFLVFVIVVMGSSTASAFSPCSYTVGYSHGSSVRGACFFEETPAGCPIRVLVPRPEPIMVTLYRGDDGVISNGATLTTVGLLEQAYATFDYLSCDCPLSHATAQFDLIEVDVPEAREGDLVQIAGGSTTIGPGGPCSAADWPSEVAISTGGCDRCPSSHGDDHEGGGCSAGRSAGLAWALGLVAIAARRRGNLRQRTRTA